MDTFAERLKATRKQSGLSQEKVAQEVGVSLNTYRNWEYGNHCPNIDAAAELGKLFEINLSWLITGAKAPTSEELEKLKQEGIGLPDDKVFEFDLPFFEEIEFNEKGNPLLQTAPEKYMQIDSKWSILDGKYVLLEKTTNNVVVGIFAGDKVCIREVKQDPRSKKFKPHQMLMYAISVYSAEEDVWQVFYRYITYLEGKLITAGSNPFFGVPEWLDKLGAKVQVFGEVLGWVHTHTPWAPVK